MAGRGASWASSDAARATMRANRGRDSAPELAVRRRVHAAGLRYRVSARPEADLRRTADLLFRPAHVVVFIDGCFWRGCPEHASSPKTNAQYWAEKIARNRERDRDTDRALSERGWTIVQLWEHAVRADPDEAAAGVVAAVRGRP